MKVIGKICIAVVIILFINMGGIYARQVVDDKGAVTATPNGKIIESNSKYKSVPTIGDEITPDSSFNSMISKIYGVAAYICYGAAVIVVLVKGIKFMNSAPDGKAEIKKEAIAIAAGATIVFGIGVFLQIIANITNNNLF